jgi:beta-1,4-N-acetylglucosaminyltransferase
MREQMKLLVILGEGGHTTELLNLVDLLGDRYEYCYILAKEDNLSTNRLRRDGVIYKLPRPRGKDTMVFTAIFKTFLATVEALKILWQVKPTAILSTGPAIAVPVSIVGKLLGIKIIFVETGSRVQTLSLTGRIMYRMADLFFVQWPQLSKKLPGAIYAGRLI